MLPFSKTNAIPKYYWELLPLGVKAINGCITTITRYAKDFPIRIDDLHCTITLYEFDIVAYLYIG